MTPLPRLVFVPIALVVLLNWPSHYSALADQQTESRSLTTQQIAATSASAVVTIVTFDRDGKRVAQGSGIVVKSDGTILTNWHVMAGSARATVTVKTGESFDRVNFIDGDKTADVVVLKVPGFGLAAAQITSALPEVGSRVVVLGSPLGLTGTVSEGIVSGVRLVAGRQLVQITAAISPGSSGGPVIDSMGRTFAIATESLEGRGVQQLNFAVPVKYAMGLLGSDAVGRPIADSPIGVVPKRSPFAESAADFASWSRPDRSVSPVASLGGEYAFISRTTQSGTERPKSKGIGVVVVGDQVGLVSTPSGDGKTFQAAPIGPLTSGAGGVVALGFGGANFAGYQTDEGFWVSHEASGELVEIQTKRIRTSRTEPTGLYGVTCKTRSVSSLSIAGATYPMRDPGPEWTGEVAVIVAGDQIHVDLLMRNPQGGSVRWNASGTIGAGQFSLVDGGQRLTGTLSAGVIEGQWVDQRPGNVRFEGPLRAVRK